MASPHLKTIMSPKVPTVIHVADDEGTIVSEIGTDPSENKADSKQIAVLNGRRKRILPQSTYKETLDSIIQRDYFPIELSTQNSVRSSDTSSTLTGFHAKTASDRQVEFQLGLDKDASDQRTHVETTKYSNSSVEQNPVFFPVVPRGKPKNGLETLPVSTTQSYTDSSTRTIASRHQNIVPSATRFPQPKPKVPRHWENDTVDDASSSNGFTDLDSTIVLSLRSEIRRGKLRQRKTSSKSVAPRRTVQPPLNSDESIGYALRKAYKRPRKSSSSSITSSVKR